MLIEPGWTEQGRDRSRKGAGKEQERNRTGKGFIITDILAAAAGRSGGRRGGWGVGRVCALQSPSSRPQSNGLTRDDQETITRRSRKRSRIKTRQKNGRCCRWGEYRRTHMYIVEYRVMQREKHAQRGEDRLREEKESAGRGGGGWSSLCAYAPHDEGRHHRHRQEMGKLETKHGGDNTWICGYLKGYRTAHRLRRGRSLTAPLG